MTAARATAAFLAAGALAACGGSSSGGAGADRLQAASQVRQLPGSQISCQDPSGDQPDKQHYATAPAITIQPVAYTARVVTNCGTIVIALDARHARQTVNSFAFLAGHHYFDNSPCHRLTEQGIFVLQCGDPTGTGRGGPGYTIPDENLAHASYPAGTVAMANTGQPHTGGSQFFFVYADTDLPPAYTPFGHVVSGLDVLRAVAHQGSDDTNGPGDGAPLQPVVIESFTVQRAG